MPLLIIKEDIGAEGSQEISLGEPAQEQAFVQANIPFPQCAYHPLMGRSTAGSDQCRADWAAFHGKAVLKLVQSRQKRLERPPIHRLPGGALFVFGKGFKPIALEDLFRLIREQHRISIKGNPQDAIGPLALAARENRGSRIAGFQDLLNISGISGKKQVRPKRRDVTVGTFPPGKGSTGDRQTVMELNTRRPVSELFLDSRITSTLPLPSSSSLMASSFCTSGKASPGANTSSS